MPKAADMVHMIAPGPISKLSTKCGKRLTSRSKGFLATHPARATCKACASVGFVEIEVERAKRGPVPAEHQKYFDWADGPDSGMSSKALVQAVTGARVCRFGDEKLHPSDPDDFGRCRDVVQLFPELRDGFARVAALSPQWAALIGAWDELESFTPSSAGWQAQYVRMRELLYG